MFCDTVVTYDETTDLLAKLCHNPNKTKSIDFNKKYKV